MFLRVCGPGRHRRSPPCPGSAEGVIGEAYAARLGNAFQPRGDIDAVTENVVVIKNDVTDMDTDAEFDPLILRHGDVLLSHTALNFNRTARSIYGACEFGQHTVTGCLDDAASMGGYSGVSKGLSDRLQPGQRTFLVAPIKRLYPATSAARTAASRRSTRSPLTKRPAIGY